MMNPQKIERLGQALFSCVLPNGLPVYYYPKPGFQKKYALYATNYGSVDEVFSYGGRQIVTPAGVAHFLEHKLFEQPDGGNALTEFARTGASPNAYTSQTMTAYHFECTDRFYENLEILLGFVNSPYFTDENVAKEQGIIGQEIGMVNDNPAWRAFTGLFDTLFADHRISSPIIGTVESISHITPDTLLTCHKSFYSPKNMVLVVAGDVDFEKVLALAEKFTPTENALPAGRTYATGNPRAADARHVRRMAVSMPIFLAGFRDVPPEKGIARQRHISLAALAAEYLCGPSSSLYAQLYQKGLISRDFESEYVPFPEGGALIAGGESRNPDAVFSAIIGAAKRISQAGLDTALFERLKKSAYGRKVRYLDSPETLCREQAESTFCGGHFIDFPDIYERIQAEDLILYIKQNITGDGGGLSIIEPGEQI